MNNDLISRSALLENIEKSRKAHASVRSRLTVGDMEWMIKGANAIDAVEVVRCGDCKHSSGRFLDSAGGNIVGIWCDRRDRIVPLYGYCHEGEKMDAKTEKRTIEKWTIENKEG